MKNVDSVKVSIGARARSHLVPGNHGALGTNGLIVMLHVAVVPNFVIENVKRFDRIQPIGDDRLSMRICVAAKIPAIFAIVRPNRVPTMKSGPHGARAGRKSV